MAKDMDIGNPLALRPREGRSWLERRTMEDLQLTEEERRTKAVFLKFQAILNKLTPQKFRALAEKTLQLPINTEERLSGVVDRIFRRALIMEGPNYSVAYANLCRVMALLKVETAGTEGKTNVITFFRKLMTKCQQEFDKDKHYDEEREVMVKAIEEAATPEAKKQCKEVLELADIRARRRSLGNIRFIGELFKLKMLSETVVHECIVRLLRSSTDEKSLEGLALLIATTGKNLDIEKAKPLTDLYFNRISEIIKKGKISLRLKFILQDILDLRSNKWVPRRRMWQDSQPKTIDQIHAEARMEAEQQKQMISQHQAMNYGRRDSCDLDTVGGRRKGRDSAKTGRPSDDWPQRTEKEKKIQKKPDVSRLQSLGKKAAPGQQVLRPTGAAWGKGAALSSMASANHPSGGAPQEGKKSLRSSSSGSRKGGMSKKSAPAPPHIHPDNQQRPSSVHDKEQQASGSQQLSSARGLAPRDARSLFRRQAFRGTTSGFCLGYLQANLVALPSHCADAFEELCRRNHGPLPLLYRSKRGEVEAPPLARDSDVRSDVPRYSVFSNGVSSVTAEADGDDALLDLSGFQWDQMVTFYIGCSFSFEDALLSAGVPIRNVAEGRNVSIFKTNILCRSPCLPQTAGSDDVGGASKLVCPMVVSMRPIPRDLLEKTIAVSSLFPNAHGAPVHIGDPARIGMPADLSFGKSEEECYGDPTEVRENEVPVFWGCGVTVRQAVRALKPELAFTHYPGSMFITDLKVTSPPPLSLDPAQYPCVVPLSRDGAPFFASFVSHEAALKFSRMEEVILEDPGQRGIRPLFQESDLLGATLALSHASSVAITTGFPANFRCQQKLEMDGPHGVLVVAQALAGLGKRVVLICDARDKTTLESCVHQVTSVKAGTSTARATAQGSIEVWSYSEARDVVFSKREDGSPMFDCLLAIERPGRANDQSYYTMNAVDISEHVEPVDDLFLVAMEHHPRVATIGIGDGGNEVGMGKVCGRVKEHVPKGDTIASCVATDFLLACGVSNWGGYALAAGLFVASSCPLHWRYRNHAISAETPPPFRIEQFLPTAEETTSFLKHLNSLGVGDPCVAAGASGLSMSVDGLPLDTHLQKLEELALLCNDV